MVSEPSDAARLEVSLIFLDPMYGYMYFFAPRLPGFFFFSLSLTRVCFVRLFFFSLSFLIPLFFFTQ